VCVCVCVCVHARMRECDILSPLQSTPLRLVKLALGGICVSPEFKKVLKNKQLKVIDLF
jgi:hypothetical protein